MSAWWSVPLGLAAATAAAAWTGRRSLRRERLALDAASVVVRARTAAVAAVRPATGRP